MRHHPFANLFPMQSDEEIQSLADDIAKHGLRQPIVIDADEMILDGRNRSAACAIAQVKPVYEPFVGSDAQKLAYVVSVNVHRRHLTTSQRAEIAATIATMKAGENQHTGKKKKEGGSNELPSKPVTTEQAAKLMNVSVASVKRAKAKAATVKPVASKPASPPKATPAKAEPEASKASHDLEGRVYSVMLKLLPYLQQMNIGPDSQPKISKALKSLDDRGRNDVLAVLMHLESVVGLADQLSEILKPKRKKPTTSGNQ